MSCDESPLLGKKEGEGLAERKTLNGEEKRPRNGVFQVREGEREGGKWREVEEQVTWEEGGERMASYGHVKLLSLWQPEVLRGTGPGRKERREEGREKGRKRGCARRRRRKRRKRKLAHGVTCDCQGERLLFLTSAV